MLPDILADITAKLVPLRRERTSPRAVKRARHNAYRVKRPGERCTRHTNPPTINIGALPPRAA